MVKFGWDKLKRFLAQANSWTGTQTFASIVVTSSMTIPQILEGYTTTVTAAGTTTLTVSSNYHQFFTGSTTQTVKMPVTSTLTLGQDFRIVNKSSGVVTVTSSGDNSIVAMVPNSECILTCILITGTTAASWDIEYSGISSVTGTGAMVLATSPTLVTPALGTPASGDLSNCSLATPPAIGGTTANTLRAKFDEDLEPATDSISTNQCAGGVINNVGQSGNAILTLPAAAEGYNFTVILGVTAAFYFRILTLDAANDKIYLDGVAGSDDGYVQVASAAVGNTIQFFTFQTAAGVYDWYACTVSGSWVAG